MTDKFEEWLEKRIVFATKQTKEELGLPYFHSVSGRKKAFEDALSQYREFLKEQNTNKNFEEWFQDFKPQKLPVDSILKLWLKWAFEAGAK